MKRWDGTLGSWGCSFGVLRPGWTPGPEQPAQSSALTLVWVGRWASTEWFPVFTCNFCARLSCRGNYSCITAIPEWSWCRTYLTLTPLHQFYYSVYFWFGVSRARWLRLQADYCEGTLIFRISHWCGHRVIPGLLFQVTSEHQVSWYWAAAAGFCLWEKQIRDSPSPHPDLILRMSFCCHLGIVGVACALGLVFSFKIR